MVWKFILSPPTSSSKLHLLYHGYSFFISHFVYHHTTNYGDPSASNTTFPSIVHIQFNTTTITTSTPTIPFLQFITTITTITSFTTFPACDLCELGNFYPHNQWHTPFSLCFLHKGEGQRGRARRHWEWEWERVRGRETVGTWWCRKSLVSHIVLTCSRQHMRNKNKEDLVEDTSVVLAKYPPKVKLENFHNFRVLELGKLCIPWFMRVLRFL